VTEERSDELDEKVCNCSSSFSNPAGQKSRSSSISKDLPASYLARNAATAAVSVSSFMLLTPLKDLGNLEGALRERVTVDGAVGW